MGITESGCTQKGCMWCPSQTPGDPWCIYKVCVIISIEKNYKRGKKIK